MSCEAWEIRIASEDVTANAHLAVCENCRRFAAELEWNAQAMKDASDLVLPKARRSPRIPVGAYAAAAAVIVAMVSYFPLATRENPVDMISFHLPPPHAPEVKLSAPPPPKAWKTPALQASVIKIVTDDPDVVILLVDSKGDL